MSAVRPVEVAERFAGTVAEAERSWYAPQAWPRWVDGCERILSVDPDWPRAGTGLTWESGPAGRGQVSERVVQYEPLRGMTAEVADASLRGVQTVTFVPEGEEVSVVLALSYRLERRSLVSPLVDVLFIRRAMAASLQTTLHRFGVELQAARREQ
jgi:hypothetical protein